MAIKIALLCLSFALLVATSQYCSECSPPWKSFRGFCYLLIDTPKSFWEAEGYCESLSRPGRDAHLVSVTDGPEEAFIEEYAQPFEENIVWIGFTLNFTTNEYYWVDGTTYSVEEDYEDWAGGKPRRWEQFCAILSQGDRWAESYCEMKHPFICKIHEKYGYTKYIRGQIV